MECISNATFGFVPLFSLFTSVQHISLGFQRKPMHNRSFSLGFASHHKHHMKLSQIPLNLLLTYKVYNRKSFISLRLCVYVVQWNFLCIIRLREREKVFQDFDGVVACDNQLFAVFMDVMVNSEHFFYILRIPMKTLNTCVASTKCGAKCAKLERMHN